MCYKGKCMGCIPVEHGCLVFAILSAVASCLALVASIITMVVAGGILTQNNPDSSDAAILGMLFASDLEGLVVTILAPLLSLFGFVFSVLLCNGICNRRPGQVKAYFVYGVVITVITFLMSVGQICTEVDATLGIIALLVCAVYSLFLVLVHQTYAKLLVFAVKEGHIRLVEGETLQPEAEIF